MQGPGAETQEKAADQPTTVTALLLATLDDLARHQRSTDTPLKEGKEGAAHPEGEATLSTLLDRLDERAFGLLLLFFALPCCIPFLWGIPQIVALPMLALAAQLAAGREAPWLPDGLRDRRIDIQSMRGVVQRTARYLGWVERFARPRFSTLTDGAAVRVVGALMLIPCASILVPLPSTNTAPGIGVAIASIGLIERDGLLVIVGLLLGLAWVALLIFGFFYFGAEALDIIKEMILGRGSPPVAVN
ncbi:Uncharacterized ABC-type transport system, permease component [Parvularcula bermudensis HTCC2503]|uniref:Uncharacterized ABC-type transport system, permease component n=1 Tax=Parvularcula bermudensis (strain ATCC BAA-594 / HTCC2503 / KCTC 12087) TaxID=314260 RepID=E0TD95_PARBH|nr:exopolysaccharide biosynthesis protein [Parvularcula bermudensis]ADM09918.1 Uncharacterized ABC-type transport system, permease component [Parvularcula bermudensis HTCC2503]